MQQRRDKGQNIAVEQVEGLIKDAPAQMDTQRGQALGTLASIKRAKLVQARRERGRMEARYGTDDVRVRKADQRMRRQHQQMVNTRAERDRASVPVLARDERSWQVHGFVRSREGEPIPGATVALFQDRDGTEGELLQGKTDSKGYFKLAVGPGADKGPRRKKKEAESDWYTSEADRQGDTEEALLALKDDAPKEGGGSGLTINTNVQAQRLRQAARAIRNPVYLGASAGKSRKIDARILYPSPGNIIYRDIELDVEQTDACGLRTQFLGNSSTRELHSLAREKPGCQIAAMRSDHRVYFESEAEAQAMGYDFCAHCYGKSKSRR